MKKSNTDIRGIEIIDMLAAEGATYTEAHSILRSAEFELGKREHGETKNKPVQIKKLESK